MNDIFEFIKQQLALTSQKRIVFPEFTDERVLRAANRLSTENIITPIYIGEEETIKQYAKQFNIKLAHHEVFNPQTFEHIEALAKVNVERRKGRIDIHTALE